MKNIVFVLIAIIISTAGWSQNFKRYGFKSGIIEYKYEGKTTGTEMLYFDDYGELEAKVDKTTTKIFGVKSQENKVTILNKAEVITVDLIKNTAYKTGNPVLEGVSENKDFDYIEFGENMLTQMGYEKNGSETILGKKCDVWKGMGTIWVWKGISMKVKMNVLGAKFEMTVTDIKTNINVPSSKFKVPDGIKVLDNPMDAAFVEGGNSEESFESHESEEVPNAEEVEEFNKVLKGFGKAFGKKGDKNGENPLKGLFGKGSDEELEIDVEEFSEQIQEFLKELEKGKAELRKMRYADFKKEILRADPKASDQDIRKAYEAIQEIAK